MHLDVSSFIKGHAAARIFFNRLLLLLFLFFLSKPWQRISPLLLFLRLSSILFFDLCKFIGVIIRVGDELSPLLPHYRDHLVLVASVKNHIFVFILFEFVVFVV